VSDTDIPYESGDDAEYGLTPEQREQLRRSMEILSRAIEPIGPKLQSIVGPGFNKLAADMLKLPSFRLPESIFKNIAGAKPLTDAQSQWVKQLGVINSDVFKSAALAQSNLDSITAQLTKNVDFGLSGSFAKGLQQFAAQQSSWLRDLGSTLGRLKASFYPPNLREIAGLRLEEVEQVVMVDGIALYNVPRASIAEALIRADGASGRREILGRRWKAILADCRTAVDDCKTETVAPYVTMAVAALNALDAGHAEAAQALTGSLLDAIVNTYFGMERHHYTPDKSGRRTNAAYDEFGAHQYIAFAPVWQAWQKFFPDEGKPVPHTFSRNATAHTVSAKQFTRRNAVQGLMIVCGILVFLDEQARVVEGRSVD
jgi:hypothetical protein